MIILSAVDAPESIFEAFESGVRGYMPTLSTTLELAIEVIRLVKVGGTFLPPNCLYSRKASPSPGTERGADPARELAGGPFTPRQMAVIERLQLGKANKIIAHDLGMSESTAKVHIRNIMKKMKATNRTEAACRAVLG